MSPLDSCHFCERMQSGLCRIMDSKGLGAGQDCDGLSLEALRKNQGARFI